MVNALSLRTVVAGLAYFAAIGGKSGASFPLIVLFQSVPSF